MAKVVKQIRNDIYEQEEMDDNSFSDTTSIPLSLQTIISMLLYGTNITQIASNALSPSVQTISQLILFNSLKRSRTNRNGNRRHSNRREPPIPVYMALKVHALTRKKELIDMMFNLGVSVSYTRAQDIITALAKKVCEQYN